MGGESKTVANLKGQLSKFSGIIPRRVKKAKRKLIKEMLYGIQAGKDVKLSNIARALKEDQPLIKTEDRLSSNLDDVDFREVYINTRRNWKNLRREEKSPDPILNQDQEVFWGQKK